ncbi:MAG: hypothetical protein P8N94_02740 [Gammaproteobacteria bacterium]|nr:hypothetical protein [Gammaproteobacteria bacterium]
MATALAKYEPQTLGELKDYSELVANSQLVPQALRGKPADIMLALQLGDEVGLSPVQALQSVAIVNGKPAIYGDAALALVMGSGLCENIHESVEDGVATCRVTRRGMQEQSRTFSIDDAKRAGLWGKNVWKAYPLRLLQLRARGFALRDLFPDVLKGVITTEEANDYPTQARELPPLNKGAAPRPTDQVESRPAPDSDREAAEARVTAAGFPPIRALEESPPEEITDAEIVEEPKKKAKKITKAQITKVQATIKSHKLDWETMSPMIYGAYGIESLKELPADQVSDCIDRIASFAARSEATDG